MTQGEQNQGQRIDKLLWFLRFTKSRSDAQKLSEQGHIRLDGRRVERAHIPVRIGAVLTIPWGQSSRSVRILSLPDRRGPASEMQQFYEELGG